jgi:glycosyltransferase involved in cell wall biosynthesis
MISIIISVHNSEKYLRECLDSVVKQIFKDYECICVIDTNEDNSLAILQEYAKIDSRFKITKKCNGTTNVSRNTGLSMQNAFDKHFVFALNCATFPIKEIHFKSNNTSNKKDRVFSIWKRRCLFYFHFVLFTRKNLRCNWGR